MVKAYILNGLGIGCHEECAHAYQKAGADAEIIHITGKSYRMKDRSAKDLVDKKQKE